MSSKKPKFVDTKVDHTATQMRKGILGYCVLQILSRGPAYSSDILLTLQEADLVVSGGTIYPLLTRLKEDGLVAHKWRESKQGPPRKYFTVTPKGIDALEALKTDIDSMYKSVKKVERTTAKA